MADSGDSAATIAAAREREKRLRSITPDGTGRHRHHRRDRHHRYGQPGGGTPLRLFRRRARRPECEDPHALAPSGSPRFPPRPLSRDGREARHRNRPRRGRQAQGRDDLPPRVSRSERSSSIRGGSSPASSTTSPSGRPSSRRAGILQQELMHASRLSAMGEMASGIAHELNPAADGRHELHAGGAAAARPP